MSVYTSIKITRKKAMEVVFSHINGIDNDDLKALVNHILAGGDSLRNIYQIVGDDEENQDDEIS